jgi:prevent-host-death family protein
MATASITQAKNGLSALLDRVKAGESVIITDRGVPIARIEPIQRTDDWDARMAKLVAEGKVIPGNGMPADELLRRMRAIERPKLPEGASLLEAVLEERESGW